MGSRNGAVGPIIAPVNGIGDWGGAVPQVVWALGLAVLAAPVRSQQRLHACVALAATTVRMDALGRETVARRLVESGRRIAARLEGEHDA